MHARRYAKFPAPATCHTDLVTLKRCGAGVGLVWGWCRAGGLSTRPSRRVGGPLWCILCGVGGGGGGGGGKVDTVYMTVLRLITDNLNLAE